MLYIIRHLVYVYTRCPMIHQKKELFYLYFKRSNQEPILSFIDNITLKY